MGTQSLCAERSAPSSGGTWPHIRLWALAGFPPSPNGTTMGGGGLLAGPHGADPPSSLKRPEAFEVSAPAFALLPFRLFPLFASSLPALSGTSHFISGPWHGCQSDLLKGQVTPLLKTSLQVEREVLDRSQKALYSLSPVTSSTLSPATSFFFVLLQAYDLLAVYGCTCLAPTAHGALELSLPSAEGSSTDISLVHPHFLRVFPQMSHHWTIYTCSHLS